MAVSYTSAEQEALIRGIAKRHGVDPDAAVAVAKTEGLLGSGIGDGGTSFGPFQLHQGGALPKAYWNNPQKALSWSQSPAGIEYAISSMAKYAKGLTGESAVRAIVYRFERPSNPAGEVSRAMNFYKESSKSNSGGILGGIKKIGGIGSDVAEGALLGPQGAVIAGAGHIPGVGNLVPDLPSIPGLPKNIKDAIDLPGKVAGAIETIFDPHNWLRGGYIIGGGIFILTGLVLVARSTGVTNAVTQGATAVVAPEVAAATKVSGKIAPKRAENKSFDTAFGQGRAAEKRAQARSAGRAYERSQARATGAGSAQNRDGIGF